MLPLFKKPFQGGVHPRGHKAATTHKTIQTMPMPAHLYVPLQQHIGAAAEPEVAPGDKVLKGQMLARSQGMISAPVHAPTSGTVVAIEPRTAPHPSGLSVLTIVIEADGADHWDESCHVVPINPFSLETPKIAQQVGQAGIVGMGGATFPSAVKLKLSARRKIHTLIINGGECEPYLTCDDRLMQERAEEIVDGIRIILHTIQAERALLVIEDNKPTAIANMQAVCSHAADIKVVTVPSRYPMGSEKHIIKAVTGLEVPAGGLGADIGVLVHNMGTAYAIHRTLRQARPLISRIVTVGGGAVRTPQNVEVPIGALLSDVIDFCGGFEEMPARIIMGGPMMGQVMPTLEVPVVKGTSGIIALTANELANEQTMPCIRCGRCVQACPCGLVPLDMSALIRNDNLDKAQEIGLIDCVGCGCCAYVCPSHIPLVQYFNYAKGELAARQKAKHRAEETKKLAEQRQARLQREAEEKAAAAAKRKEEAARKKAEKEAQKKAEAEKKAAEKKQTELAKQQSADSPIESVEVTS